MTGNALKRQSLKLATSPIRCRPFLKWVGGKGQLLPELVSRIPENIGSYFEPLVGGGALLFHYQPTCAFISDANSELINAYEVVKNDVDALIEDLKAHVYEESYFYNLRDSDRTSTYKEWSPVKRASRLIYLNKTCFNGLYRVNSKGHFNTPFGKYTNPKILDESNLRACSAVLQNVNIAENSFEKVEFAAKGDDFVYFDPPYVPLSATSTFTGYSQGGFDLDMQRSLFDVCCRLDKRGIRFMLSNSSALFVVDLYKKFKVEFVSATRSINAKANKRGAIKEVIVTNY